MANSNKHHSSNLNLGRNTESRINTDQCRSSTQIQNPNWFKKRKYTEDRLSTGHLTDREYYAYDASGLIIKGHCCYERIEAALADEGLKPIRTTDGRAMVSIWFNLIRDSVCGAYHEIAISIDATTFDQQCVVDISSKNNPFHFLYNNFGSSVCKFQFMHSLYINNRISIAWGREMQAFPKHTEPVDSMIEDKTDFFESKAQWGKETVCSTRVRKQSGMAQFVQQGWNLVTSIGPMRLLKFATAKQFEVPIQMPRKIADERELPSRYLATVRKGRHPRAVRSWPWHDLDTLELGSVTKMSGGEVNNGHSLIRQADFAPKVVTYLPFMQAYINAM